MIRLTDYIPHIADSALAPWADLTPWDLVTQAPNVVRQLLAGLPAADYDIQDDIAVNYRNERADKEVQVRIDGRLQRTGCDKFGALLGDQCRVGANGVLAPGAVLKPGSVVGRGQVFDGEVQVK